MIQRKAPAILLRGQQLVQDMMEDLDGQVVGEVEIRERSADPAPAEFPLFGSLGQRSIVDPLTLLRKNGFLLHFRIELLRRDNPTPE